MDYEYATILQGIITEDRIRFNLQVQNVPMDLLYTYELLHQHILMEKFSRLKAHSIQP
jgi:hypothetical protein